MVFAACGADASRMERTQPYGLPLAPQSESQSLLFVKSVWPLECHGRSADYRLKESAYDKNE